MTTITFFEVSVSLNNMVNNLLKPSTAQRDMIEPTVKYASTSHQIMCSIQSYGTSELVTSNMVLQDLAKKRTMNPLYHAYTRGSMTGLITRLLHNGLVVKQVGTVNGVSSNVYSLSGSGQNCLINIEKHQIDFVSGLSPTLS